MGLDIDIDIGLYVDIGLDACSLSGGRMVRAPGRGTHAPVVRARNPPGIMSLHARDYVNGNDAQ